MPPTNGRGSAALTKTKTELSKYKSKLSGVRREAKNSELPNALMGAGAVLGGAAGCGVARAFVGDEFMGVPTDVGLGLLIGGISIGMGSSVGVMLAAGCLAPYVGDAAKDAVSSMGSATGGMGGLLPGETTVIEDDYEEVPETADIFGNGTFG